MHYYETLLMARSKTKMSTLWKQLKTQLLLIEPGITFDVLLRIFHFETITIHFDGVEILDYTTRYQISFALLTLVT